MDDDSGSAERAFQDLAAEVNVTRRAVQALQAAWNKNPPADITETLGHLLARLNRVNEQLAAIEQHPALRLAPVSYTQQIRAGGEKIVSDAVQRLDHATRAAIAERSELAAMIGAMRGKRRQWKWLGWTAAVALMLGLILSPVLAGTLPFGWNGQVAAFVMRKDRWNAGIALMQASNPSGWEVLSSEINLSIANHAALSACREAAAKTKKEQRCSVVVSAP